MIFYILINCRKIISKVKSKDNFLKINLKEITSSPKKYSSIIVNDIKMDFFVSLLKNSELTLTPSNSLNLKKETKTTYEKKVSKNEKMKETSVKIYRHNMKTMTKDQVNNSKRITYSKPIYRTKESAKILNKSFDRIKKIDSKDINDINNNKIKRNTEFQKVEKAVRIVSAINNVKKLLSHSIGDKKKKKNINDEDKNAIEKESENKNKENNLINQKVDEKKVQFIGEDNLLTQKNPYIKKKTESKEEKKINKDSAKNLQINNNSNEANKSNKANYKNKNNNTTAMPLLSQLVSSNAEIPENKIEKENLEEIYLSPITYDKLNPENIINHEAFCEAFFITSFPKKNGEVIEKSQSFPAPCGHKECSSLPSMKPKIIYRYPLVDTKNLELNDLASTICFPTGIKVCYSDDENYSPKLIEDYITQVTNQKGERYYMLTYHFYLRMDNIAYAEEYEMHPLKDHFRNFANEYLDLTEKEMNKKQNKIQKDLEQAQNLGNSNFVFIPYCICLISKYPFINELKLCLRSIYYLLVNKIEKEQDLNNLIMHLINAVPIPEKETLVRFYIPYCPHEIEIKCPKLNDLKIINKKISDLLKLFSIDYILIIFRFILFEKKILFIDDDYTRLSSVSDNFISLIYPFQWIHTYIPIMSDQMIEYLQTYLPFINGIHSSLLPWVTQIYQTGDMEQNEEIFLVYIKESKFRLGSSLIEKNWRKKNKYKYVEENVPPLPSSIEKNLKNKLKKIKEEIDSNKNKENINTDIYGLKIRIAFIEVFVEMFCDVEKYLTFLDQDVVFNKNLFLEKIDKEDKKFYDEFIDTQLFQLFTQNVVKDELNYFKNKVDDYTKHGKQFMPKKEKEHYNNKKLYIISPDYLDIRNKKDNENILGEINQKYDLNAIEKNKEKIAQNMQIIDEKNYIIDKLKIYIIPKTKEERIANKRTFYLINKISADKNKSNKYVKPFVRKYILAKYKENEMSEKEQDELKERIKDFTVKIFKSENLNTEDSNLLKEILNDLNTKIGREFFVNLLSKNTSNIILLQPNFFVLLGTLIYNILLNLLKEEGPHTLEETVRLIKSLKFFGKEEKTTISSMLKNEKQKTVTLWDLYLQKIQKYAKVNQANLWYKWYQIDLMAEKENAKDETKRNVIINLCKLMVEIKLNNSFIKKTLDELIKIVFEKKEDKKIEVMNDIQKIILNKK